MRRFFLRIRPPRQWEITVLIITGIGAGIAAYIFFISNAASYMSDDPKACINCHVMTPQYASWQTSSHATHASCNDCHVPHDNIFRKYYFKANDGMRHASIYTLRKEPQVILIKDEGASVVQENCIRCHQSILQDVSIHQVTYEGSRRGEGKTCWECHRDVPHGRVHSLSSAPHARVPGLREAVPDWLKVFIPLVEQQMSNKEITHEPHQ